MSKLRYVIVPWRERWTIRCAGRRIGAFLQRTDAVSAAVQVASLRAVRGHAVEVLEQDVDGRWVRVTAAYTR